MSPAPIPPSSPPPRQAKPVGWARRAEGGGRLVPEDGGGGGTHRPRRPRRPPTRRKGPPGPVLIFVPPLVLCVGLVGVAALHNALGQPLGSAWAAEVWSLAKTAITAMLAISGAGAYMHHNNRRAWELAEAQDPRALERGGDDGDGGTGGGEASQSSGHRPREVAVVSTIADRPPRPVTRRPAATSQEVRNRRTGRLTPVEAPSVGAGHETGIPPSAENSVARGITGRQGDVRGGERPR